MDDEIGKGGVAAVDLWANAFVAVMGLLVVLFLLINPPTHRDTEKPLGNLSVTIMWPVSNMSDVDLWSKAPDEIEPVGYSDPQGRHFSLTHDDRPLLNPTEFGHFEIATWRGIFPGEYIENVHLYGPVQTPVPVQMTVDCTLPNGSRVHLLDRTVTLTDPGEEQTVLRFVLTKDCGIEQGSVDHVFVPLRTASEGGY